MRATLEQATSRPFTVINDADAAGVAEMEFGAGKHRMGVVVMVTLGTGIGTAVFVDGKLVPEHRARPHRGRRHATPRHAPGKARESKALSWKKWGGRVNAYLQKLEALLNPELIIIGGGISKKPEKFFGYLNTRAELVAA